MHAPCSAAVPARFPAFGLPARVLVIACVLGVETLLLSYLIQGTPVMEARGLAAAVHSAQHWLFRFLIAYAASLAILIYVGRERQYAAAAAAPVRLRYAALHAALMLPFALLSATLYSPTAGAPFWLLALGWHACALAAALALCLCLAPQAVWAATFRAARALPLVALAPALGAVLAIHWSQQLWHPAARVSFALVDMMLRPFVRGLMVDPVSLAIGTRRFAVIVSDVCSGLEGVGLMIVFCSAWLWYFRHEFRFPRALLIIPLAILLVFLLNAVRIAALFLIGDAGYPAIAAVGFHSQAGWIAFNLVAFSVALLAKRSAWLRRAGPEAVAAGASENPTATYLVPLLAILAAGMIAHALSGGFDLLYPLRLIAALAVFWLYRRRYRSMDWRFSWRGIGVGVAVFAIWAVLARWTQVPAAEPAALAALPAAERAIWILGRVLAAVVTVPLAEELAYRGFLLRRLQTADFEAVPYRNLHWPALLGSSAAFGVTHGSMWFAGSLAGLAYGAVAIRANRLGEAVAAHATTNALVAAEVLLFGQWQLW
jgi:exosortase E/protease (VPEID-CTERM system)